MTELLHHLVQATAHRFPRLSALSYRGDVLDYAALNERIDAAATGFANLGLKRRDRVAIYLEKRFETVIAIFGAAAVGGVFVPINPILKPHQVGYILRDCNVRVLVTSKSRVSDLRDEIERCSDLDCIVYVDTDDGPSIGRVKGLSWNALITSRKSPAVPLIDADMAAILYTSGSTGNPKGVILSHRNLVAGANSVSQYLRNTADDRILSVLPLSFDAGLSQLTTAFTVGAKVTLLNYLLPRDVIRICAEERVTGITGVPPLWFQLAELEWPKEASDSIRYFANTGGHMPRRTLDQLRLAMPKAKPYLMYGLTEAFRSTYLDPAEVDHRPDSIGKAIPNAEILVVRPNGELCDANEVGELVHRGALVAMGYWNDPEKTAARFRPTPGQPAGIPLPELAVWSGDQVRRDENGFLYFVGRLDGMIKTSGYRVSPTEVEEVIFATSLVGSAVVLGVPHPTLGQGIIAVVTPPTSGTVDGDGLMHECRRRLPQYMVPLVVFERATLPRNPNGKIDRNQLAAEYAATFHRQSEPTS